MGYAIVIGQCIGCGKIFGFNINRVPSTAAITGRREPVCRECIEAVNPLRIAKGLAPVEILDGAYDVMDESEI